MTTLQDIKSRFRLMMNGVASKSMRDKGMGYKINWGIGLPELKQLAAEYGKDHDLAVQLWKEDIRECKLLATMMMPADKMQTDMVELWGSELPNQEVAEMLAFHLLRHVEGIKDIALKWLATDNELMQLCGYQTLAGLFAKDVDLDTRELNEVIDQAQVAWCTGGLGLRHAVANAMQRLADRSEEYGKIFKSAFKNIDLDIF